MNKNNKSLLFLIIIILCTIQNKIHAKDITHVPVESTNLNIEFYTAPNGKVPYNDWVSSLQSNAIALKLLTKRIGQLKEGFLGDYNKIKYHGEGDLYELRLSTGHRVYFSCFNLENIIIWLGGHKATQEKDLKKAAEYLSQLNL